MKRDLSISLSSSHSLSFHLDLPRICLEEHNGVRRDVEPSNFLLLSASDEQKSYQIDYQITDGRVFQGRASITTAGSGWIWQFTLQPHDGLAWQLESTTEGTGWITGWENLDTLRLFHGDNIRGVSQQVGLLQGSYWISLSEWQLPLNRGRWQSFPGAWIGDSQGGEGFVMGVLSQDIWRHEWHGHSVIHEGVRCEGRMRPPGILFRPFEPGEIYQSEPLYFEMVKAKQPVDAFAGYLAELEFRLRPCKKKSILCHAAFWDSWNDRQPHFWDVSMELIERTADVLTARFPAVRSLEIDDGYAHAGFHEAEEDLWTQLEHGIDPTTERKITKRVRKLGAGFAYEPGLAVALDRFPDGMATAAKRIVKRGLSPAIWLGLHVVHDANVVKAHPEWFVEITPQSGDDPELAGVFAGNGSNRCYVFDPSVPEAREYLNYVFEILFSRWGFQALKLDFWSYIFENDGFRLRYGDHSALEWREWFLNLARSFLPEKSFLTLCCDISTGNPFFCKWADTIRYGIDIGNGKWESIFNSALVGTFLLHVEANRFYILNSDSIGVLKNLEPSERTCFWIWAAVTRSLCEIAGDLAISDQIDRAPLEKLLLAPKNGDPVRFGEQDHLERNEPASILFTPGDLFSEKSNHALLPAGVLAIFNWSDSDREIEVCLEKLGLSGSTWMEVDFFHPDKVMKRGEKWTVCLPPRCARMTHLARYCENVPILLDSYWAIRDIEWTDGILSLEAHGISQRGMLFSWPGKAALEVKFTNCACSVYSVGKGFFRVSLEKPTDGLTVWFLSLS